MPVLQPSPGQLSVTVCLGRPDLGPAVHLPVSLVGGDGGGHALPNNGRRAPAPIGPLPITTNAGPVQEPSLSCLGPGIPHSLGSWGFNLGFHPGLVSGERERERETERPDICRRLCPSRGGARGGPGFAAPAGTDPSSRSAHRLGGGGLGRRARPAARGRGRMLITPEVRI